MKLIDKQKALDALMAERKYLIARGQEGVEHVLTHHAYNIIDEQPIIESRPKGKWIRGKIDDENVWYCSNCRHIDDYYGPTANYCWYCGTDMRGDDK